MRLNKHLLIVPAAIAMAMTSCTDNGYDLSNIDTTIQAEVNDLVIPIELDTIKLKTILNVEDGDKIKEINGVYAVQETGSFQSGDVTINEINIACPSVALSDKLELNVNVDPLTNAAKLYREFIKDPSANPTIKELKEFAKNYSHLGVSLPDDMTLITFSIKDNTEKAKQHIDFEAKNIDKSVKSIEHLGTNANINIDIRLKGLEDYVSSLTIDDLKLVLPAGLETTNTHYATENNITRLYYNEIIAENSMLHIGIDVKGIDYAKAEKDGAKFDGAKHTFSLNKECSATGSVAIKLKDLRESVTLNQIENVHNIAIDYKANITFDNGANINTFTVNTFTGDIQYDVDNINVKPIDLSSLPEFLKQTGTKLGFADPQIYISVTNPVKSGVNKDATINPTAQLTIIPAKPASSETFTANVAFPDEKNYYCLSPNEHTTFIGGEDNGKPCKFVEFANLGKILQGEENGNYKIPNEINIKVDPKIDGHVTNFHLCAPGSTFGQVVGNYNFYVPLQFTDDTKISYGETVDGWSSKDLDALTITSLKITADVEKSIPAGIEAKVYPINKKGERIKDGGKEIVGTAELGTEAKSKLNVELKGKIENLDGIDIVLNAKAKNGEPLSPNMSIIVKNLRPSVSGSYTKEF